VHERFRVLEAVLNGHREAASGVGGWASDNLEAPMLAEKMAELVKTTNRQAEEIRRLKSSSNQGIARLGPAPKIGTHHHHIRPIAAVTALRALFLRPLTSHLPLLLLCSLAKLGRDHPTLPKT
jgi:hypothetical protein